MDTTETETVIVRSMSFEEKDNKVDLGTTEPKLEASDQKFDKNSKVKTAVQINKRTILLPEVEPTLLFSQRSVSELDAASTKIQKSYRSYTRRRINAAAIKIQKVYKSYRTRRNLADCAVVAEEQWWKASHFCRWKASSSGAPKRSSESLNIEKHETAESCRGRARTRGANAGKGLSMIQRADKLALQHWLESIDPRHRYGHNLQFYYDVWSETNSKQRFFYWLDIGDGKDINLSKCPRTDLKRQGIRYARPGISAEWTFLLSGLCLEILSIAFDQASSPSKPQYALFGMTLAFGALLICIWELIYKCKKERVELRRWGMLWWYYYPNSPYRLFGTLPDFYGLIGSTSQCICSTVQYVWVARHADNPIKVSLWPAIFLICLGAKRLTENRNKAQDEHRD